MKKEKLIEYLKTHKGWQVYYTDNGSCQIYKKKVKDDMDDEQWKKFTKANLLFEIDQSAELGDGYTPTIVEILTASLDGTTDSV